MCGTQRVNSFHQNAPEKHSERVTPQADGSSSLREVGVKGSAERGDLTFSACIRGYRPTVLQVEVTLLKVAIKN